MTITHRCQMKRFTNEIIRILKNKRQRAIPIRTIPSEYGKHNRIEPIQSNSNMTRSETLFKKNFHVADFGMCYLEDLVNEIKDNKELVVDHENQVIKLYRKGTL
jgi:hypothetical protein